MSKLKQWLRKRLVENPSGMEHAMSPTTLAMYRLHRLLMGLSLLGVGAAFALHAAGVF